MAELFLEGVRVLDLSRLLPGPFCSLLLADMGAEVIKIEDTRGGDYARIYPPVDDEGMGTFFASINRNKRSMTLDLKTEEGASFFRKMASQADVVLESFRPGVMDRLGVGYETLREANPGLIYCAITGYGQDGPLVEAAGHDNGYLALAGLLGLNGSAAEGPVIPGFQLADIGGGALYAALGITSALYRREKSGDGSFLDISMTEGALSFGLPMFAATSAGEPPQRGTSMLGGGIGAYNIYETSDGRHLAVGSLEPKFWMTFVSATGLEELVTDGHDVAPDGGEPRKKIAARIAEKSLDEWTEIFSSVDACVEPVLTLPEVLEHELHRARKVFFDLQGVKHARTPLTPRDRAHTRAPEQGADTREVVEEFGGDFAELAAAGAFGER